MTGLSATTQKSGPPHAHEGFQGSLAMFTKTTIPKPSFRAFEFLYRMKGSRLACESSNEPIGGMACISPDKACAWVLLYSLIEFAAATLIAGGSGTCRPSPTPTAAHGWRSLWYTCGVQECSQISLPGCATRPWALEFTAFGLVRVRRTENQKFDESLCLPQLFIARGSETCHLSALEAILLPAKSNSFNAQTEMCLSTTKGLGYVIPAGTHSVFDRRRFHRFGAWSTRPLAGNRTVRRVRGMGQRRSVH